MDFEETKSTVSFIRRMCVDMDLENAHILSKYSDEQLSLMYNGIGPDYFPKWIVRILDNSAPELAPSCMIHDVEWLESDGTKSSFKESNDRLRRNGKATADLIYGFWSFRRYIVRWDARAMSKACQMFGWDTWSSYGKRDGLFIPTAIRVFC